MSGLIHDETDNKILILYVAARLPAPVDRETLFEICLCDGGVEYFDFSEYLESLVESGNISVTSDGEYAITEKGAKNGRELENSLPKSVRMAADKAIAPAAAMLRRYGLIKCTQTEDENGITVHLAVNDGEVELLRADVFCGDAERASVIRKNFRKNAEGYYTRILDILTENKRKIK